MSDGHDDSRRSANARIRDRVKLIIKECELDGTSPEQPIRAEFCGAELQTALSMLKRRANSSPEDQQPRFNEFNNPTPSSDPPSLPDLGSGYQLTNEEGWPRFGGKGTVWKAKNVRLNRVVIVKTLHRAGTRQRLEEEAQKLAQVVHPNVVAVHGVVYAQNVQRAAYLEMEYVPDPVSITKFCDSQKLSVRKRLELFIGLCNGVHAVHESMILHLDLKPDNVLVSESALVPIAKVIDLGLARLASDEHHPPNSGAAVRPSGTYMYLAPEQIDGTVGIRTDIYTLGLILFELLTGSAHQAIILDGEASLQEADRKIVNARPISPIKFVQQSTDSAAIAECRSTPLAKLTSELSGELDWISGKALENNPRGRYASAEALAADIQRHLDDEIVVAHPKSRQYCWPKVYRKHRLLTWSAGLILFSMTIGLIGTSLGFVSARNSRGVAQAAEDESYSILYESTDDASRYLLGTHNSKSPLISGYLRRSLARWESVANRHGSSLRSMTFRAEGKRRVADILRHLGNLEQAKTAYSEALVTLKALHKMHPEDASTRHNLAIVNASLASALGQSNDLIGAEREFQKAINVLDSLATEFPSVMAFRRSLGTSKNNFASILTASGDLAGSEATLHSALVTRSLLCSDFPEQVILQHERATTYMNLGMLHNEQGHHADAIEWLTKAQDAQQQLCKNDPNNPEFLEQLSTCLNEMASMQRSTGNFLAAKTAYEQLRTTYANLAMIYPGVVLFNSNLARTRLALGVICSDLGDSSAARAEYEAAYRILRRLIDDCPDVSEYQGRCGIVCNDLAILLLSQNEHESARAILEEGRKIWQAAVLQNDTVPDFRSGLADCINALGVLESAVGNRTAAVKEFEASNQIQDEILERWPHIHECRATLAGSHNNIGAMFREMGDFEAAAKHNAKAIQHRTRLVDDCPMVQEYKQDLASSYVNLGLVEMNQNRIGAALSAFDRARQIRQTLVDQTPEVPEYRTRLASVEYNAALATAQGGDLVKSMDQLGVVLRVLTTGIPEGYFDAERSRLLKLTYRDRANLQVQLGLYNEAAQSCKDALVDSVDDHERSGFRLILVESQLRARSFVEAISELEQIALDDNDNEEGWTAPQLYQLAYLHALASNHRVEDQTSWRDAAMVFLQRAVESGLNTASHRNHMIRDKDIDSIRDRDDFKKLLESMPAPSELAPY